MQPRRKRSDSIDIKRKKLVRGYAEVGTAEEEDITTIQAYQVE